VAKKSVAEMLAEKMPGMEVVEDPPAPPADSTAAKSVRAASRPGPSMDELRKKYLGTDGGVEPAAADAAGDDADVEVKTVRPKGGPADPAGPSGRRTVIVSKKKGVLGSQG
jgi:hypothetical protein